MPNTTQTETASASQNCAFNVILEPMTPVDLALEALGDSSESAALAVRDHLETVASNGDESATVEAMRAEAQSLIGWAQNFLDATKGAVDTIGYGDGVSENGDH